MTRSAWLIVGLVFVVVLLVVFRSHCRLCRLTSDTQATYDA